MKTKPYSILVVSAVAIAATGQEPARNPRGGERGARPAPIERIMGGGDLEQNMLLRLLDNPRIAEAIELTEEQRKTLAGAFEPFDAQLEEIRPKLQEAIQVQTALLGELKPNEDRLMAAVEDVWMIRTEIAKIQTRKLMALRAHLTGEQLNRAREMMENFRQRGAAGFQGRREDPAGARRPPAAEGARRGPRGAGERPRPPAQGAPRRPGN